MITITKNENCCGCEACVQVCPKHCISFCQDLEGFYYPSVNKSECINCGLCERVCPCANLFDVIIPIESYAARNKDERVRALSSSGGVFQLLASQIISSNGVVFGASFNEKWEVLHTEATSLVEIEKFQGSKYVQSRIGDSFQSVELCLKQGRPVLFSGTPCQVSGLRHFLNKEYDYLYCVDVICHGVPSPLVWKKYLDDIRYDRKRMYSDKPCIPTISDVSFRDKTYGWDRYSLSITFEENNIRQKTIPQIGIDNPYMKAFILNWSLRPSCYNCPSKNGSSGSDITIADFWGISNAIPEFDDDKGTNLVLINTEKGKRLFAGIEDAKIIRIRTDYSLSIAHNPSYKESVSLNDKRNLFFSKLNSTQSLISIINSLQRGSLFQRLIRGGKRKMDQLFQKL